MIIGILVMIAVWVLTMLPPFRKPIRITAEFIVNLWERTFCREEFLFPFLLLMSFAVVAIPITVIWVGLSWIGLV